MKSDKVDMWIKPGYKLLGTEGLDGLKIERLARILHLNKSGFYHYFGSMKSYVNNLFQHHVELSRTIASEMAKCETIDPDLLRLIVKYKPFFLVESQMLLKSRSSSHIKTFDVAGKIVAKEFLGLLQKSEFPKYHNVTPEYLNILRHFFYARINSETITYDFLHRLIVEIKSVLDNAINVKHLSKV